MKRLSPVLVSAALLALVAHPAAAQRVGDRTHRWYWGAQAGVFYYQTGVQGYSFEPMIGGHWLITGKRTALYVAYEQAVMLSDANAVVIDRSAGACSYGTGCRDVTFSDMRRIMFGLLAYPKHGYMEPFFGGGFAMMQVLNPVVDCTGCIGSDQAEAENRTQEASSKAFFLLMAGLQINRGKMSLFGHYILTSAAQSFLIQGTTHSFQGGLRYSFGTAKEGIGGDRN